MGSRCTASVRALDGNDPLFDSSALFPLGAPFGRVEDCDAMPSTARPFGLHFAVVPDGVITLDTTVISYDPVRQMSVARDGGQWVPLARHTDGKTNTKTSDCKNGLDSDDDWRED